MLDRMRAIGEDEEGDGGEDQALLALLANLWSPEAGLRKMGKMGKNLPGQSQISWTV